MKRKPWLSILLALFIGIIGATCCREEGILPPPQSVDFAIYDESGMDNLFDEDGPFMLDSLRIFQGDGITEVSFLGVESTGGISVVRYLNSTGETFVENPYFLHLPNGAVDTLIGVFNFTEGDKCNSSFWTFGKLNYNGIHFSEEDENGLIKVLRDF